MCVGVPYPAMNENAFRGHRVNGMSARIGASGEYYTSSSRVGRSQLVWSIECGILQRGRCYVGFRPACRSECNMIRCIQE